MADENPVISPFARLPEEIVEEILSYLRSNYEQNLARLVCRLWYKLLVRIRKRRQQLFVNAIKSQNGKLYYRGDHHLHYPGNGPSARFSHASCVIDGNLCVFGGCSPKNTEYNDLYVFNVTERKWSKPRTSGVAPLPRECATLVSYHNYAVLYGGCSQPVSSQRHLYGRFFSDLHIFDFVDKTWSTAENYGNVCPPELAGHSASVVGDRMIVFGGGWRDNRLSDVWSYDLKEQEWSYPHTWGEEPEGRFGHSQITLKDDNPKIIIIGGSGAQDRLLSDVWLLFITFWNWCRIETLETIHSAPNIWSHPAIMVEDWVLIFANAQAAPLSLSAPPMVMYALDCSKLASERCCTWQPVHKKFTSSIATCLHSVNVIDDMIFIFGGLRNQEDVNSANNALRIVTSLVM